MVVFVVHCFDFVWCPQQLVDTDHDLANVCVSALSELSLGLRCFPERDCN